MQNLAVVLACLALTAYGMRVQPWLEELGVDASSNPSKALTALLVASNPSSAFTAIHAGVPARAFTGARPARIAGGSPMMLKAEEMVKAKETVKAEEMVKAKETDKAEEMVKAEEENEFISDDLQKNFNEFAYLLMRLAVASVMVHHGQEKILSAEMFTKYAIDKYFAFLPGPHIYWTYIVGYIQYLAPVFMALGVFSRAAAASLTGVMAGAFLQSIIQNGWEKFPMFELAGLNQKLKFGIPIFHNYGFEVPLLYVSVFLLVAVTGPGKFSIAQLIGWNDDKSLLGKLKQ